MNGNIGWILNLIVLVGIGASGGMAYQSNKSEMKELRKLVVRGQYDRWKGSDMYIWVEEADAILSATDHPIVVKLPDPLIIIRRREALEDEAAERAWQTESRR